MTEDEMRERLMAALMDAVGPLMGKGAGKILALRSYIIVDLGRGDAGAMGVCQQDVDRSVKKHEELIYQTLDKMEGERTGISDKVVVRDKARGN